jgi:hypothetical protein
MGWPHGSNSEKGTSLSRPYTDDDEANTMRFTPRSRQAWSRCKVPFTFTFQ